jgi:SAM-dependent methyltransferase
MNKAHLAGCSSAEWAEAVRKWIIPWVLEGVELGDDVLEIGPGPGLTTDVLRETVPQLTAVELDPDLAGALTARMAGTNVTVVQADATDTGLPARRFTGAVCLSMLHHVPSPEQQDAVFAEALRVLRPGGILVGEDSLDSTKVREAHVDDVYVPLVPDVLAGRLTAQGFTGIEITTNDWAVRFRAHRPH